MIGRLIVLALDYFFMGPKIQLCLGLLVVIDQDYLYYISAAFSICWTWDPKSSVNLLLCATRAGVESELASTDPRYCHVFSYIHVDVDHTRTRIVRLIYGMPFLCIWMSTKDYPAENGDTSVVCAVPVEALNATGFDYHYSCRWNLEFKATT